LGNPTTMDLAVRVAHLRRAVGSVDLEQIMSDKDLRNASSFVVKAGVDRAFQDVVAPRDQTRLFEACGCCL
jgi:hypothetical protein